MESATRFAAQLRLERPEVAALAELAAMLVHHAQVHEQVRAEHVELEVGALDVQARLVAHALEQRVGERAVAKHLRCAHRLGQAGRALGQRHKAAARLLRQALEQGLNLVFEHARHQPLTALLAHLVEHEQRHRHTHAVSGVARLVQIRRCAVHATQTDLLGESLCRDARGLVAHELFAGEEQALGVGARLLAPPLLEQTAVEHLAGDLRVVKRGDQFLVHQHVLAARLVFQLLDLGNHFLVGGQKRQRRVPLAVHQGLANEDVARAHRVDRAIGFAPAVVNRQPVKRGAFKGHDLGGFFLPMGVEQLLLDQVRPHVF